MKNFILAGFLLLSGILVAQQTQEVKTVSAKETHPLVELHNNVKWFANSETTQAIENMTSVSEAYLKEKSGDYSNLKSVLEEEFNSLVRKCTMKGEAHKQLHHYIYPLQDKIEAVTHEHETVNDLLQYLNTYDLYFQ